MRLSHAFALRTNGSAQCTKSALTILFPRGRGLVIGLITVAWASRFGKVSAIVVIVPIVGGFWTAMRGIAFLKRPNEGKLHTPIAPEK
jgi:uncharacterized membrane protein (Fun14 family)